MCSDLFPVINEALINSFLVSSSKGQRVVIEPTAILGRFKQGAGCFPL